jgi:hypothetical protein
VRWPFYFAFLCCRPWARARDIRFEADTVIGVGELGEDSLVLALRSAREPFRRGVDGGSQTYCRSHLRHQHSDNRLNLPTIWRSSRSSAGQGSRGRGRRTKAWQGRGVFAGVSGSTFMELDDDRPPGPRGIGRATGKATDGGWCHRPLALDRAVK